MYKKLGVSITFVMVMQNIIAFMAKQNRIAPRKALAENVRHLMAAHGDNQATLAKRSGVSQSNISYVINSDRHVRLDTVEAIASAYGLEGWHLINPNLPLDLIESPSLNKLISTYANANAEGRRMIDAVAEREASYSGKKVS